MVEELVFGGLVPLLLGWTLPMMSFSSAWRSFLPSGRLSFVFDDELGVGLVSALIVINPSKKLTKNVEKNEKNQIFQFF